jgi:dolichyl-phosphate-mannose-protein mannosyltransferase
MDKVTRIIAAVLGSRKFTFATLGFFVFESLWVALSAVYPMAFDEDFHFGLINLYGHHWLPFLSSQPDGTSQFGPLYRDPSYLYHYLMSFPLRFIELFTHNQAAEVVFLRLINIALFGVGLVLFYRLARRAGAGRRLANVTLALFVLIPIVPLLAGQINYDNLFFPAVALTCLLVLRAQEQLRARKLSAALVVGLLVLFLLSCLVKYAYLPIAVAAGVYVLAYAWRTFHKDGRAFLRMMLASYRQTTLGARLGLAAVFVLASVLFAQRYVPNLVSYHTPVPRCDVVLSENECMSYDPWARDYNYAHTKTAVDKKPTSYFWLWLQGMHLRLFFAINGPASGFVNYSPVPVPAVSFIVLTALLTVALAWRWRQTLARRPFLIFLFGMSLLYMGVLFLDNYLDYLYTGRPVAINGRYLLVVAFPLAAVLGRALGLAMRQWRTARLWLAAALVLLFLQGGGVFSFILRSDASWDWPNSMVIHLNNAARDVISPVMVDGSKFVD